MLVFDFIAIAKQLRVPSHTKPGAYYSRFSLGNPCVALLTLLCFLTSHIALPLHTQAQETPPEYTEGEQPKKEADADEQPPELQAQQYFEMGLAASRRNRWHSARDAWKESYALVPAPLTLLNLASAYAHTHELLESEEAYLAFIEQAEQDPSLAEYLPLAQQSLRKVRKRIPSVRLIVRGLRPRDHLQLDHELLDHRLLNEIFLLNPGKHRVSITRDGYPQRWHRFFLHDKDTKRIQFDARSGRGWKPFNAAHDHVGKAPAKKKSDSIFASPIFWSIVGVLVVGGIVTAVVLATRDEEEPFTGNAPPGRIEISRF